MNKPPPPGADCEPVAALREELGAWSPAELREQIASGVHEAAKRVADDSDVQRPYWEGMVKHGGGHLVVVVRGWVGGMLIASAGIGVVVMVIKLAISEGWLK